MRAKHARQIRFGILLAREAKKQVIVLPKMSRLELGAYTSEMYRVRVDTLPDASWVDYIFGEPGETRIRITWK